MTAKVERREVLVARARGHLVATGHPRLVMLGMMVASAGAAWLASAGLLRLGVEPMWARYPLAVFAGYGALLGLLAAWVGARVVAESHHGDDPEGLFATGLAALALGSVAKKSGVVPLDEEPKEKSGGWWDCVPDSFGDLGEVGHPGAILVFAVVGGLAVLIVGAVLVATSPDILAELWVDGVGPRLDPPSGAADRASGWFGRAFRDTGGFAVFLALALSFVGWEFGHYAPGARTFGEAWSCKHSHARR